LGSLFELLGSIGTLLFSFTKDVTEEEIEKNIKFLKHYPWFQNYLDDEKFKNLINEHKDVRFIIGKLNIEKVKNKSGYHKKYQKKIHKVLLKNSN
jgi:hypothetical protein